MGSKISPILVNYVLDDLVRDCLTKIPYNIPFIKRYVDDLLLGVPEDKIDEILTVFNAYDQDIQFTVEKEANNAIPFLDMTVIRNQHNVLRTKWYRKPMSSGRYINYHSHHQQRMKINLVVALKTRVTKLTHQQYREQSLSELKELLLENSYPAHLLNKLIFSTPEQAVRQNPLNNRINGNDNVDPDNDNDNVEIVKKYKSLPFITDLTPRLINIIGGIDNIQIAIKNLKTVNSLYTKLKDPYKPLEKSNVVYKINCNNCEKVYIGQTSRTLKGRITSHKSDVTREKSSCALAEHSIKTGHKFNFERAEVLDVESNYNKRTFLEMTRINYETNSLNKRSDIDNLSKIYTFVLHTDRVS